jgi:hypothetical protein
MEEDEVPEIRVIASGLNDNSNENNFAVPLSQISPIPTPTARRSTESGSADFKSLQEQTHYFKRKTSS